MKFYAWLNISLGYVSYMQILVRSLDKEALMSLSVSIG